MKEGKQNHSWLGALNIWLSHSCTDHNWICMKRTRRSFYIKGVLFYASLFALSFPSEKWSSVDSTFFSDLTQAEDKGPKMCVLGRGGGEFCVTSLVICHRWLDPYSLQQTQNWEFWTITDTRTDTSQPPDQTVGSLQTPSLLGPQANGSGFLCANSFQLKRCYSLFLDNQSLHLKERKTWRKQKFRGDWKTIFHDSCFLTVGARVLPWHPCIFCECQVGRVSKATKAAIKMESMKMAIQH